MSSEQTNSCNGGAIIGALCPSFCISDVKTGGLTMENEQMMQPWRNEKYNKIRERFIDKLYRNVHTTLENDMMHLLSDYSIKIDNLQRMVISLTKELDNLRQENVFLLDQINELIDNADDVGCSGIYVDKK